VRNHAWSVPEWYSGTVVDILALRPSSVIKDDNIATLLHAAQRPIFATINASDFWQKIPAHPNYSVVAIEMNQADAPLLPDILRQLLNHPELKSRASRLGKVILVRKSRINYYEQDGQIHELV